MGYTCLDCSKSAGKCPCCGKAKPIAKGYVVCRDCVMGEEIPVTLADFAYNRIPVKYPYALDVQLTTKEKRCGDSKKERILAGYSRWSDTHG